MIGFLSKKNNEAEWLKVSELEIGMEIAVPKGKVFSQYFEEGAALDCPNDNVLTEGEGEVMWDEIVSIEKVGEEKVYDIEVEGTHNFVAGKKMGETAFGGLFAHNTYVTGNIGAGTSTPYAALSAAVGTSGTAIAADALTGFTGTLLDLKVASTTKFSVSGTGFATTTVSGLNISGQATSTSNVGFNITTGCFAINGTCVGGGTGSGLTSYDAWTHPDANTSATTTLRMSFLQASSTLLSANQAWFGGTGTTTITNAGYVGIATTSPFSVGSSTGSYLYVSPTGNVGIGTAAPISKLTVTNSNNENTLYTYSGPTNLLAQTELSMSGVDKVASNVFTRKGDDTTRWAAVGAFADATGTNNTAAVWAEAGSSNSTGNPGSLYGVISNVSHFSSYAAGTAPAMYGFQASLLSDTSVGSAYGIKVNGTLSGTTANIYGLYLDAISGTVPVTHIRFIQIPLARLL